MLWEAAGRPFDLEQVCPQRFRAPRAPSRAAAIEGRRVDSKFLRTGLEFWCDKCDIVVVEGAGGLMSPLSEEDYNIDLARDLGFPLVIVAANELGVINATLQTLITARAKAPELPIAGIVLNQSARREGDESLASNAEELAARCEAPLLATVAYGAGRFDARIDWFAAAQQSTMHAKDLTTEHTETTEKRIDV
jgi:dethiobiotin synthetase